MDLSYHSPLYLKLSLELDQRNTLWRLNTDNLDHIKDQTKVDIKDCLLQNDGKVSPPILWDAAWKVKKKLATIPTYRGIGKRKSELKLLERDHKDTADNQRTTNEGNEINEIYTKHIQKRLVFTKLFE